MRIKRKLSIAPSVAAVKNAGLAIALLGGLSAVAIPTAASASSANLVDAKFTVRFKVSQLAEEGGTEAVYTKIEKKAKRACVSVKEASEILGETFDECVDDVMNQFVISADVPALITYHEAKTQPVEAEKFASNSN